MTVKKQIKSLCIFALVSLAQTYFTCPACATPRVYLMVSLVTFLMWLLLWKGNNLVNHYLNSKISWLHEPVKRLILGFISTISYTLIAIFVLLYAFSKVFNFDFGSQYQSTVYLCMIITILVSLFMHGREFLLSWRKAKIDAERHEKESIAARYESLKNQVNPHFLFNSLNALTNLVYEDPDKAVKFIKQLSEVYRYVLDTRDKEVVPLRDELTFINSYNYLQQIRFGDKLKVQIDPLDDDTLIAPLALQLLFENAIKHNIVSHDDPLTIHVFSQSDFIVVKNNLQRKLASTEPSAGIGLENIRRRYEFLSNRKVEVCEDDRSFSVKLPVIKEDI